MIFKFKNRKNSFVHLKDWLEDVKKYASEEPLLTVLGNKSDLMDKKQVLESDIKVYLNSYKKAFSSMTGLEVFEASAKESLGVNEIMENLTKRLIKRQ